ncbi:hypothetical protein [Streptomyces flaveolus]|uniref:hypothetical protein n=1 Tax=Streptomyces flaveolus TaxID=67297 RepID=UPI00167176E6|nr:hypothetical protein [Streptomyces flaveolus]GGQ82562.1 hypothetical protein GCM10010216_50240 [Streptomyces flaveolus]
MTDHRLEGPGENGVPVPRDLPDQQAGAGEDPWEAAPARAKQDPADGTDDDKEAGRDEPADSGDTDVPDTDEAGTGPQGAPRSGNVHPEHPVPDESSG